MDVCVVCLYFPLVYHRHPPFFPSVFVLSRRKNELAAGPGTMQWKQEPESKQKFTAGKKLWYKINVAE